MRACRNSTAWTPSSTLHSAWRAWAPRVGERPGSKAAFASRMRAAGIKAHRRNVAKGWRFKITDINEIEENITTATRARKKAHDAHDLNAKALAVREQKIAERRAGAWLEINPGFAHELGEAKSKICIALARLTDAQFAAKVETIVAQAVAALSVPSPSVSCPRIKMVASPWFVEDGVLTRTLMAVEVEDDGAEART